MTISADAADSAAATNHSMGSVRASVDGVETFEELVAAERSNEEEATI